MSGDLWGFLMDIPSGGYAVESSHCTGDECSSYTGNIDPNNFREFNLVSLDGKVTKKVGVDIVNFFEPKIRLNVDDSGKKISLDIAPENCRVTKDGFLCIDKSKQDCKFKFLIKKP